MKPGDTHGRLKAVRQLDGSVWEFDCSCGNKHVAYRHNVERGATKSCGCLRRERLQKMAGNNEIVRSELMEEFLEIQEVYQFTPNQLSQICRRKPETVKRWTRKSGSTITIESMELLRGHIRANYH